MKEKNPNAFTHNKHSACSWFRLCNWNILRQAQRSHSHVSRQNVCYEDRYFGDLGQPWWKQNSYQVILMSTPQWIWGLNTNYCPVRRDIKFLGRGHPARGRGGPRGSEYIKASDFLNVRHYEGGSSSAIRTGRLYPRRNSWYSLSRPQDTWFRRMKPRKKSPVTPAGIDPGTVRLVAQCLKHYVTPFLVTWNAFTTARCTQHGIESLNQLRSDDGKRVPQCKYGFNISKLTFVRSVLSAMMW